MLRQGRVAELRADLEELVLTRYVKRGGLDRPELLVIEVATSDGRCGVVADGKPGLGDCSETEVVGSAPTAHLCGNPARLKGIRVDSWPTSGYRKREHDVKELAVGVGLGTVPWTPDPLQVVQARVAAAMHA